MTIQVVLRDIRTSVCLMFVLHLLYESIPPETISLLKNPYICGLIEIYHVRGGI